MKRPVIEFRDFGFRYAAQAEATLSHIDLTIREGEKVLICGPSGCGKSTLVHCINGLIPGSYEGEITGELTINGQPYQELDVFRLSKTVGTVLQDSDGQFVGLSVGEDIAFALENDRMPLERMYVRVRETAARVGMESFLDHAPHELSGGQKQRVSLAGVMVDDVKILLFDEPLANLDPAAGKSAIELIDEIHRETGDTVVIVEHRLEDVLHRDVDRIVLMAEGRIVADMTPDELLSSSLLKENGIREPLYVTALKYAGVFITPEMRPGRIERLQLTEEDKAQVRAWYQSVPAAVPAAPGEAFLKAEKINFSYSNGKQALYDIDFSIQKGEMMSIVGKNGAGKSTFSKIICGFERPQSGRITLAGRDLSGDSIKERADHIGYVMQNPNQMISKTMIAEEVGLGLALSGKHTPEEISDCVNNTLKICGLYPFRNWPISALSFGQKKRVTVASILAMNPEIVILDEPTAGQDFRHYTDIMEFLSALNEKGITIILITHDMHLMLEYCRRAVVFSEGRRIADDTCEAILTNDAIVQRASLKKTSLSQLAQLCGIPQETEFVRRFIRWDREVRGK
ncbi:MAG: ABC transporter ATP-binding protein [Clostridia bacterium]|nr:ABC transporter ATP-binding protein [Clostridia bacterium]